MGLSHAEEGAWRPQQLRQAASLLSRLERDRLAFSETEPGTHCLFLLHLRQDANSSWGLSKHPPVGAPPTHLHTPPRWRPGADARRLAWPGL